MTHDGWEYFRFEENRLLFSSAGDFQIDQDEIRQKMLKKEGGMFRVSSSGLEVLGPGGMAKLKWVAIASWGPKLLITVDDDFDRNRDKHTVTVYSLVSKVVAEEFGVGGKEFSDGVYAVRLAREDVPHKHQELLQAQILAGEEMAARYSMLMRVPSSAIEIRYGEYAKIMQRLEGAERDVERGKEELAAAEKLLSRDNNRSVTHAQEIQDESAQD